MSPYFEVVDQFKLRAKRFERIRSFLDPLPMSARASRGRPLPPEKIDALVWGLSHASPVVRRICLEMLDAHPEPRTIPHIVACLDDPIPRVRWHAVHALECDACKAGTTFLEADVFERLQRVALEDLNEKVRAYARRVVESATA